MRKFILCFCDLTTCPSCSLHCGFCVETKKSVRLEDLKAGAIVNGLAPSGLATVVMAEWFGDQAVKVVYEDSSGEPKSRLVYRSDELALEISRDGRPWSFDGDGSLLRLVSEAYRIKLAHLFDPYLAVHTSSVDALPHQISAVYGEMLARQPLRYLLADDPGAGKTIMTGLFIKELLLRGDLERCLIVAPGGLVEQWQDELHDKFGIAFDILTRDQIESVRSGNPFEERNFLIARLDMLSRNIELQERLQSSREFDLIVCDEAHKMSAHFFSGEIDYTKRYQLGRKLAEHCRHFLLLSATPHSGKEEDFQLFMALLDGDRFEGKMRDGSRKIETSDMMRRLVKEELLTFEGKKLFPERQAYTVAYRLSPEEEQLYSAVTTYVREEMNRAERFANKDEKRKVNISFALQTLQRRLASSPEAIYQSLRRRREKLEARLNEERLVHRGRAENLSEQPSSSPVTNDFWNDYDEAPEEEVEKLEDVVLDRATAAATIAELETEIATLAKLEEHAKRVRHSGSDTKWTQLNSILDDPLMIDEDGHRRKLIVFTEPKDTVNYLTEKIATRLGRPDAVVVIHGGVSREARRHAIQAFNQDKEVLVMVANDAAGEGVNLQRGHLMVNYDLPWNPNKLEQRFGRIHRIGQRKVCHLWNLVANETREGEVYKRLFEKLEIERQSLGGRVFDVLGQLFEGNALRDLLFNAILYGDSPEVKARLDEAVDKAVDREHLINLLDERALVRETMSKTRVQEIKESMDRAEARRLQPHYIRSFFVEAFRRLGGRIHEREPGRFEISHVPAAVIDRDRQIGIGTPVIKQYERITFERNKVAASPQAEFICPGHPLLDSTIDVILERYRELLKKGAVLVDDNDDSTNVRVLFYLETLVQDGRMDRNGKQQIISQKIQFVEMQSDGTMHDAGPAPYLDYRPIESDEHELAQSYIRADWLHSDFEKSVTSYAIQHVVPAQIEGVKRDKLALIDKIEAQVLERLTKEINYWDHRAEVLKAEERAGKKTKLSSANAMARAEKLADRLRRRRLELNYERDISALPPAIRGGAIIIPRGLLQSLKPEIRSNVEPDRLSSEVRDEIEQFGMQAVMDAEIALGREPRDVSDQRGLGYDIESKDKETGHLFFLEVKARWHEKDQVTLTKNEILCARNKPLNWRLALVVVTPEGPSKPKYLKDYSFGEPDFAETTRTFNLKTLLASAQDPL